jgi:DNA-binding Lrp family transcriptional regulator
VHRPLDRIDGRIVEELQKDARLSNKELAARIDLAPSSCLERVRRLRSEGVLRGFHAEVAPRALGVGLEAIVAVRLVRHERESAQGFFDHVSSQPETVAVWHMAGASDFLVQVAVRDVEHLRRFTLDRLSTREEVGHIETALIYEERRSWITPRWTDDGDAVD